MLIDACKNFAASPQSGKNYYEISKDIFGYKAGKHIIFYSQINDGKIEVVRILHSSMDLKSRL